jgi:hypothetical protein
MIADAAGEMAAPAGIASDKEKEGAIATVLESCTSKEQETRSK